MHILEKFAKKDEYIELNIGYLHKNAKYAKKFYDKTLIL